MRWLVEVSALGKSDQQKFCVEAESWQRALQAARAKRGEDGPMSGFSIELLEEGYRAVDPLARVRFVVKRAPDDMPVSPLTRGTAKANSPSKAPAAPTSASEQPTQKHMPAASSSSAVSNGGAKPNVPKPGSSGTAAPANAPTADAKKKGLTFQSAGEMKAAEAPEKPVAAERAAPPAVGSSLPGMPPVKLLNAREQDPSDASPLTYREYAFAVPEGTTEEGAIDVLRGQLRLVEAHIAASKMGKLVNLAVFDVEFSGKPPRPPLATLTWKDWKGDPVISQPGRAAAMSRQPRPPSQPPPSLAAAAHATAPQAIPAAAPVPVISQPPVAVSAPPAQAVQQQPPQQQPPPPQQHASAPPPPPVPQPQAAPQPQPAQHQGAPAQAAPQQAPVMQKAPSQPPPAPPVHRKSAPGFPAAPPPTPVMTDKAPSQPPFAAAGQQPGMVKTPSGRFVRGRVTGDELITSLFESMHDLHFLRDALDGGQFCLALATEVLPARAALIHFYDVERREWVVACTRGKDTQRLLTMRTPDADDILREAARRRRAVVMANASAAGGDRYTQLNGARSLIVAPIMQAGRALGAMEIINPLDGMPFTEDEGNAITYIAEQYAEYLGSRGIVLDRERIAAAAAH